MAAEREQLVAEIARLRLELRQRYGVSRIIGHSPAMRRVCEEIVDAAGSDLPVLVAGEAGTGKSLVARAIHLSSPRADRPFVTVSCASLPSTVVDEQLFGVPGGESRPLSGSGRLEAAEGGTLFLEQPWEIAPLAQARLAAVMEGRPFERPAGGSVLVTARIIASTTVNLEALATAGMVRHDFYRNLSTLTIAVPPLRERLADLPALAGMFVEAAAREQSRPVPSISDHAMQLLIGHTWPGNVRELRAVLEAAVRRADGPVIHDQHLPAGIPSASPADVAAPLALDEAIAGYEKELLQDALTRTGGVRSLAARLLRTSERIFTYKLRRHGIDARRFRSG